MSVTGVHVPDPEDGGTSAAPAATASPAKASTGRLGDRVFSFFAGGSGVLVIALVTLVGIFLIKGALPALTNNEGNFLTSRAWQVESTPMNFGILELLWTTVIASLIAMIIAVPLGIALALFLTQYAPPWLRRPAANLIDLLAAVPSIVYGLWGLAVLVPLLKPVQDFLQDKIGWLPIFSATGVSGGTIFIIGFVLAIMVLPIITALSREVFDQTPSAHKEGALALGATKWEMIRTAVLPFGKPGIISAAMLGLGRALGETIAVAFIVSALPVGSKWSWSLFNGGETFASRIANNSGEFGDPNKTGAFIAAGLVLFVLTFVVNAIARVIIERRKAFTE